MANENPEVLEENTTEEVVEETTKKKAKKAEAAVEEAVTEEDLKEVENAEETPEQKEADKKAEMFKENITMEDAFFRRTITLASKRGRKKAFKSEKIVGDEDGELETVGTQRKKEYDLLSDSAKASKPKILRGRVFGVEPVEVTKGIKTVYAKVNLIVDPKNEQPSLYTVNIPAPMFFIYENQEKYEGAEGFDLLYRDMQARTGSLVEFIVYDVQADDDNVLASRVGAMQIRSYDRYLGRNKQIEVGTLALGNVTYVGRHGLMCEISGAECYIPNEEVSWNYISAANDVYEVGDKVKVRILSIDTDKIKIYNNNYSFVKVTASIKQAMPNPAEKYFDNFVEGARYNGTIEMRLDTGEYFVTLGGRMSCKCKAPSFGNPYIGQNCMVMVRKKDREKKTLSGTIMHLGR